MASAPMPSGKRKPLPSFCPVQPTFDGNGPTHETTARDTRAKIARGFARWGCSLCRRRPVSAPRRGSAMSKLLERWPSVFRSRAPICIKLKSARDNQAENACCFGSRKLERLRSRLFSLRTKRGFGNRGGWQSLWACSALAIPHLHPQS
jgi:hypothetical protein